MGGGGGGGGWRGRLAGWLKNARARAHTDRQTDTDTQTHTHTHTHTHTPEHTGKPSSDLYVENYVSVQTVHAVNQVNYLH